MDVTSPSADSPEVGLFERRALPFTSVPSFPSGSGCAKAPSTVTVRTLRWVFPSPSPSDVTVETAASTAAVASSPKTDSGTAPRGMARSAAALCALLVLSGAVRMGEREAEASSSSPPSPAMVRTANSTRLWSEGRPSSSLPSKDEEDKGASATGTACHRL